MNRAPSSVTLTGPVVVGTDGSDHATGAVRWAAREAAARGQPLRIVHATAASHARLYLSPEDAQLIDAFGKDVVQGAAAVAHQLAPAVEVTTTLCEEATTECLLGEAGADGTIVVGTRGRGGFGTLLVGSDSLQVAAHSPVPVVVVPSNDDWQPTGTVLAAARDEHDRETLRLAARLAEREGASLRVLSAWVFFEYVGGMAPVFDGVGRLAANRAAATARLVAPVREEFPGLAVTEHVVRTRSVPEVLVAATADADVVVMGSRRHSHHVGSPLGHVTHAVLHHAHCPVVLIPHL